MHSIWLNKPVLLKLGVWELLIGKHLNNRKIICWWWKGTMHNILSKINQNKYIESICSFLHFVYFPSCTMKRRFFWNIQCYSIFLKFTSKDKVLIWFVIPNTILFFVLNLLFICWIEYEPSTSRVWCEVCFSTR